VSGEVDEWSGRKLGGNGVEQHRIVNVISSTLSIYVVCTHKHTVTHSTAW